MPPKRKRSSADIPIPGPEAAAIEFADSIVPQPKQTRRKISTNPDRNSDILDAPSALRASPDSDINENITPGNIKLEEDSSLSDLSDSLEAPAPKVTKKKKPAATKAKRADSETASVASTPASKPKNASANDDDGYQDPEAEDGQEATEEEVSAAISRPPPVHSSYLPLPWKGRLGYACLNTYLRQSNPPVFCSRTCRIASILEHRHPLRDPSQPEHAIKNRPDRDQPADEALGKRYLEDVCLANVADLPKMIRWNDKYGIRFMRLSSEMFPFASHEEYGYKLAPFAADALAEAGKVIAHYGHRVTTHPGQFTQLGSPRQPVIDNAIRDLNYHDEMLSLLRLPEQQNRDAVMILHMGGVFGDKQTAMQRFRENYARLSQGVKNRLVLENDDVSYTVHDLLPICEELNIPMVLDFHHHNILFDPEQLREGTADIVPLFPRILETWRRKGITPKMHYSEPEPQAITPRQRRKHNPRVSTLPPCPDDMDLMIEAKDKEQAVFQLMRDFKLPGWDSFNDIIPYVRDDDNKAALAALNKKKPVKATKKTKKMTEDQDGEEAVKQEEDPLPVLVPDAEVGMGGGHNRVFWPVTMEEWLRPKKRIVKPRESGAGSASKDKKPMNIAERKRLLALQDAAGGAGRDPSVDLDASQDSLNMSAAGNISDIKSELSESDIDATPATKKAKKALREKDRRTKEKAAANAAAKLAVADAKANTNANTNPKNAAKTKSRKAKTAAQNVDVKDEDEQSQGNVVAVPASSTTDPAPKTTAKQKSKRPASKAAPAPRKRGKKESESEEEASSSGASTDASDQDNQSDPRTNGVANGVANGLTNGLTNGIYANGAKGRQKAPVRTARAGRAKVSYVDQDDQDDQDGDEDQDENAQMDEEDKGRDEDGHDQMLVDE